MPPLKCFTSAYNNLARALINQVRALEATDTRELLQADVDSAREFSALWDTGATNTSITLKVVDECGLKPIGMTTVHTAGGKHQTETYLIDLLLPNLVRISGLKVSCVELAGDVNVLIGMDIISNGDFAVSNKDGKTVFSFRMPSTERIDFVAGFKKPAHSTKIGRNQKCPCGSGLKYKHCCGKPGS